MYRVCKPWSQTCIALEIIQMYHNIRLNPVFLQIYFRSHDIACTCEKGNLWCLWNWKIQWNLKHL